VPGDGPPEGLWVTAHLRAGRVDPIPEGGQARRAIAEVEEPRVPLLDVGQGDLEHPLPVRADEQRRPARACRSGQELAVAGLVELAVENDESLSEQGAD